METDGGSLSCVRDCEGECSSYFKKICEDTSDKSDASENLTDDEHYYKMNNEKRGLAVIFDHQNFYDQLPRLGTDKDRDRLVATFEKLKFKVKTHENLTREEVFKKLTKVSKKDHTDSDCLAIIVLSHGDYGVICVKDGSYPIKALFDFFTPDVCPSLLGKPKLFFVQACQGSRIDSGVMIETDSEPATCKIPLYADYLYGCCTMLGYADYLYGCCTMLGYRSWRCTTTGSWYIQSLCDQLDRHGSDLNLLSILTLVNQDVACNYETDGGKYSKTTIKQMPHFMSTLTKLVHF